MDNKPNKKTKFIYNPEELDICEFHIPIDHLRWKLICKQAQDLNTSTKHLINLILNRYLINTGYLDPKAPPTDDFNVHVTIRDLENNPENLFNFIPNQVLPTSEEPKELPSGDPSKDYDFGDLL